MEVDQELHDTLVSMRFPTNTGNALVDEGYRMICGYLSQADGTVLTELAVDYVRAFIGSGNDGFSAAGRGRPPDEGHQRHHAGRLLRGGRPRRLQRRRGLQAVRLTRSA